MERTTEPGSTAGTVAVILNWNRAADTIRCVEALQRSTPAVPRIIVVDNGSDQGSRDRIRARFPALRLIETGQNLGFAGGSNLGIKAALAAGAERVVLVNNDVEVDPRCISSLEAALQAGAEAGAAGPIILTARNHGRVWAAGGVLSHRENITRLRGFGQAQNGRFRDDEDVDYLPGCVLMVRRDVFEKVGLLEESFFCYMEDVDFGRRVLDAGYTNRFVAGAIAYHDASSSTGHGYTPARKYMNAVNSVHFLRRHGTWKAWLGFILFDIIGLPGAFAVATLQGRPLAAFAKMRGIIDGLRGVRVTPERVARYVRSSR